MRVSHEGGDREQRGRKRMRLQHEDNGGRSARTVTSACGREKSEGGRSAQRMSVERGTEGKVHSESRRRMKKRRRER